MLTARPAQGEADARPTIGRVRDIYAFIKANRCYFDVQTMCRASDVARSGYYAWLHEPLPEHARENARLLRLIRASFTASRGFYGAPRVFMDLRSRDEEEHRGLPASVIEVSRERLATRRSVGRRLTVLPGDKTDGMHDTVCSSSPARSRGLTPGDTAGDMAFRAPIDC